MNHLGTLLTELALEPFDRHPNLAELDRSLLALNLTRGELANPSSSASIANGPWSACRTCSDPGPDGFPSHEDEEEESEEDRG